MQPFINDSLIIKSARNIEFIKSCFATHHRSDLVYRGTRDGFQASEFHKRIGGKGFLLSIIQTTLGKIFGGYTEVAWPTDTRDLKDDKSFMYSVDHKEKYPIKKDSSRAIRNSSPITTYLFIYGHDDCYLQSEPNLSKRSYLSSFGSAYEVPANVPNKSNHLAGES
jgi:hypothetical protein